MTDALVGFLL